MSVTTATLIVALVFLIMGVVSLTVYNYVVLPMKRPPVDRGAPYRPEIVVYRDQLPAPTYDDREITLAILLDKEQERQMRQRELDDRQREREAHMRDKQYLQAQIDRLTDLIDRWMCAYQELGELKLGQIVEQVKAGHYLTQAPNGRWYIATPQGAAPIPPQLQTVEAEAWIELQDNLPKLPQPR
jgi:hypothetical protein